MSLSLVLLVIFGAAFASAVSLTYVSAVWGVAFLLSVFLMDTLIAESTPLFVAAGIQVFYGDLVMMVIATSTALRLLHVLGRSRLAAVLALLLGIAAVFLFGFVRGVGEFGPQAAGVEFRRYMGFFVAALYLASFRLGQHRLKGIMTLWTVVAGFVCAVVVVRWGLAIAAGEVGRLRVINARETMFVAQAILMSVYLLLVPNSGLVARWMAVAFLPFVVLLQHRTVWIAMMVTLLFITFREGRLRGRLLPILAATAAAAVVGSLVLFGDDGSEVLAQSATDGGTFEWRLIGWQALVSQQLTDPLQVLVGNATGAGWYRFLDGLGYAVDVSPHNWYVSLLLRTGVVGLLLYLTMIALVFRQLLRAASRAPETPLGYRTTLVVLVAQLVFSMSYEPSLEQGIVLGVAVGLAARHSAQTVASPVQLTARSFSRSPHLDPRSGPLGLSPALPRLGGDPGSASSSVDT